MDLKQNNLTKKAMKVSSGALAALSVFSNSAFALNPNDILKKAKTMVVPAVVTTATATATVSVLGLTGVLVWKIPSLMSEKTEVVSDKLIGEIANKIDLATKKKMLESFDKVREHLGLEKEGFSDFYNLLKKVEEKDYGTNFEKIYEGKFFFCVRAMLREGCLHKREEETNDAEKTILSNSVDKIKSLIRNRVPVKSENKSSVVTNLTRQPGKKSGLKPEQKSNKELDNEDKGSDQLSTPAAVVGIVEGPADSTQENTFARGEEAVAESESEGVEETSGMRPKLSRKQQEKIDIANESLVALSNEINAKLKAFNDNKCSRKVEGFSEKEVLDYMVGRHLLHKNGCVYRLLDIIATVNYRKDLGIVGTFNSYINELNGENFKNKSFDEKLYNFASRFVALFSSIAENNNNRKELFKDLDNSVVKNVCLVVKSIYEFLDVYYNPKVNGKTETVAKTEDEKVTNVPEATKNDTETK